MKPYLKNYKIFILLAGILQIGLYLFSMYGMLAPSPLKKLVTHHIDREAYTSTTRFFLASYKEYDHIADAPRPMYYEKNNTYLTTDPAILSRHFAERMESLAPGETVHQVVREVFGFAFSKIQAVGIWGNSLYGYNLMTYTQNTKLIIDGNPHRFEMHKLWQPYTVRPVYLLLDYLTILASLFLVPFTFTQVRAHLRKKSRLCTKCAYPRLKTDSDTTCPECGQLNPAEPPAPQPQ